MVQNTSVEILSPETDVMTGGSSRDRYLLYQLLISMRKAKRIDIIVSFLMESGPLWICLIIIPLLLTMRF